MISHICISDLHAGALTSLLNDLPGQSGERSGVTTAFADALGAFLGEAADGPQKPQLILLGDVLDLQFSPRELAVETATGFLKALSDTDRLASKVIATAGNHDHALWSDARLGLHATDAAKGAAERNPTEATLAFTETEAAKSRLLDTVLKRAGFDGADFRYPNIGFGDTSRAVLLHHGHFVEPPYRLMSVIKDWLHGPRVTVSTEDLSAENAGWIDFAWSSFGDAAGLGRDAEQLYQNMLTTQGFRRLSKAWSPKIADALAEALPMSGHPTLRRVLGTLSQVGLDASLGKYRDTERFHEGEALTHGGLEGLRWYLEKPARSQLDEELKGVPKDLTFVFGHTHKPFASRITVEKIPEVIKVYNTGGWTLNGPRLDTAEGAGLLLISDALDVALVRIFKTPDNGKIREAYVEMLLTSSASSAAFKSDIETWLRNTSEAWKALAEAARVAYEKRQRLLLSLTGDKSRDLTIRAAE